LSSLPSRRDIPSRAGKIDETIDVLVRECFAEFFDNLFVGISEAAARKYLSCVWIEGEGVYFVEADFRYSIEKFFHITIDGIFQYSRQVSLFAFLEAVRAGSQGDAAGISISYSHCCRPSSELFLVPSKSI
jgi:hypothetical protein